MKISAWQIRDLGFPEPKYREITVSFDDDAAFPGESVEVMVRLDLQDLPISEIKQLAIKKAKALIAAINLL